MGIKLMNSEKGKIGIIEDKAVVINDASDFLDIISNAGVNTLAIKKDNIVDSFFDLKTGIAGEILQKVSNYRLRIVIIGDFENVEKKSLSDFIYESNKTGKVVFVKDINQGIKYLK